MWIVCQIGAREHYAIPRALHQKGALTALFTDLWVPPRSPLAKLPRIRRLRDRFHPDLADASVVAPNYRMLGCEGKSRLAQHKGWDAILPRNEMFQQEVLRQLDRLATDNPLPTTLFSYSYAALDLFRYAKQRGWQTVLGQIDPGPEEERIVAEEHTRYPDFGSSWQPAPPHYWDSWREEIDLADRIIVNSEWSRHCLRKEGVPDEKLEVIPLVYQKSEQSPTETPTDRSTEPQALHLLFLGQINLRKGVGRLLEAMRLLKDEPIHLTLAGPTEIDPAEWNDLPNVRWIGPVPRSEVGTVYRSADIFILPTLSDGYALTQLEALAHGLPVIASKRCGDAVTHGSNGWLLEDLEPKTITAAILEAEVNFETISVDGPSFSLDDLSAALLGEGGAQRQTHSTNGSESVPDLTGSEKRNP